MRAARPIRHWRRVWFISAFFRSGTSKQRQDFSSAEAFLVTFWAQKVTSLRRKSRLSLCYKDVLKQSPFGAKPAFLSVLFDENVAAPMPYIYPRSLPSTNNHPLHLPIPPLIQNLNKIHALWQRAHINQLTKQQRGLYGLSGLVE